MKSNDQKAAIFYLLKNLLLVLAVALIVSIVTDSGIFKKNDGANEQSNSDKSDTKPIPVQEKIVIPEDVYNLSGRILKIDGNTIIFNAEIYGVDEKGERIVRNEQRLAIVNAQTEISTLVFVNRSPVTKKINFSDLKSGDYVDIISDTYIGKLQEFLAKKVRVKPSF